MKRMAVVVVCGGLLLAGCGGPADDKPAARPSDPDKAGPQEAKTPIVRSLLGAIDQVEGENGEVKDELRRTLRENDEQLSQVLGGNSRRLIEQANKKPPPPTIGDAGKPIAKTQGR